MEDNKPELEQTEKKPSKMNALKNKMHPRRLLDNRIVVVLISLSRTIKRILPLVIGLIVGFLVGARMNDVGFLAGHFNKDLRGATVFLSGKCSVNGKERIPSLNEDEVKIISISADKIQGVVRLTREFIECKTNEVATDTLPLLKDIMITPVSTPELTLPVAAEVEKPAYFELNKKTLVMSGTCTDENDQTMPTFTDEKVVVTQIAANKEDPSKFSLAGVKKSDKMRIKCISDAIQYEIASPEALVEPVKIEDKTSFRGETLIVTGTCFPDPRAPSKIRANFFRLTNSKILVTDEVMVEKKMTKIYGKALEKDFRGIDMICDQARMPFIYKEYNKNEQELDTGIDSSDNTKPDLKTSLTDKKLSNELAPAKTPEVIAPAAEEKVKE